MLSFFAWYLVILILGWLTFPLAYRLFPSLADRGYSLARALALLVWGYVFWMMASLRIIQNNLGGLVLALVVLVGISAAALLRRRQDGGLEFDYRSVWDWVKSNLRLVVTVEILFFLAFAIWAFVQASDPEITTAGGEKTMELAFINAILRSPTFPPHDPWLSGYAISYYYFGYVMTAMLAELTGVSGGVAHNLMLVLVFALSVIGAYGVLYNLLAAWHNRKSKIVNRKSQIANHRSSLGLPLLGPFFLLIVSNFEGFLEVLHRRGLFWTFKADGSASSSFWTWLNIKDLSLPPSVPLGWIPERFIWWWRASRVVQDFNLAGVWNEVIDEFPFFSYMLGDLHPHVLAMPFDLLAVALALNLFLGSWQGETNLFGLRLPISRTGFLFSAFVLGGLAFLNTWDVLFGFALVGGVYLLERVQENGWKWKRLEEILAFILPAGVLAILLYLPFYVGFSSQASGILPDLDSPTRGAHLWVFFGPLFLPVIAYLIYLWRAEKHTFDWKLGFGLAAGVILLLWIFSWLLALLVRLRDPALVQYYLDLEGGLSMVLLFSATVVRRLAYTGSWLTLLAMIGATLAILIPLFQKRPDKRASSSAKSEAGTPSGWKSLTVFLLLLVLTALLLILVPDFIYLRDMFSNRTNTIFKFYYQAWLMLSLVAAFSVAVLLQNLRATWGWLYRIGLGVVIVMALFYPAFALPNKTDNFKLPAFNRLLAAGHASGDPSALRTALGVWTLDGADQFDSQYPDDAAAARWLWTAPFGVIAEATKPDASYTDYAHISAYSGLPAVLGWPFHEDQWRGSYDPQGNRSNDIQRLYEVRSWDEAKAILDQYSIRYVYVGTLERQAYHISEQKFQQNMVQVFKQGQVVIYEAP